jgi:hypothetical protein
MIQFVMPEESKRYLSGSPHATTLSDGLKFLTASRPPSTLWHHSTEKLSLVRRPLSPAESESPSELLRRALSVRPVESTASSFAERMKQAHDKPVDEKDYRIIGIGTCGTVFEIPGTELAIKKGDDVQAMWKDFLLTNRVYTAITDTRDMLQDAFPEQTIPRTPRCSVFLLPDSRVYWDANLKHFPQSHRTRGAAAFQMDRILPLPQPIREALIELYFDDSEKTQEEAKNDAENRDCLIRLYLGDNETPKQAIDCYDSLRNFPLRLNMIEDLKLDKFALASEIAIALAVIHWQAQVDGMDIEFVLGSAAAATPFERRRKPYTGNTLSEDLPPPTEVVHRPIYFTERTTHCWVLDFDKANHIELTVHDVDKKLVPAFLGNDPYYPRPDVDEELWAEFCRVYLMASKLILDTHPEKSPVMMSLPSRFLGKVVEMIKENEDWNPEKNIVFED